MPTSHGIPARFRAPGLSAYSIASLVTTVHANLVIPPPISGSSTPATPTPGPSTCSTVAPVHDDSVIPPPTPGPGTAGSPVTDPSSLWEQALSRLHPDDTEGIDFRATNKPGELLHNLIEATNVEKTAIEAKQWVYLDSRGERISYADKFLTVLNKYVVIVDIAISHDPHVAALVWAGFRLLLKVRFPISWVR